MELEDYYNSMYGTDDDALSLLNETQKNINSSYSDIFAKWEENFNNLDIFNDKEKIKRNMKDALKHLIINQMINIDKLNSYKKTPSANLIKKKITIFGSNSKNKDLDELIDSYVNSNDHIRTYTNTYKELYYSQNKNGLELMDAIVDNALKEVVGSQTVTKELNSLVETRTKEKIVTKVKRKIPGFSLHKAAKFGMEMSTKPEIKMVNDLYKLDKNLYENNDLYKKRYKAYNKFVSSEKQSFFSFSSSLNKEVKEIEFVFPDKIKKDERKNVDWENENENSKQFRQTMNALYGQHILKKYGNTYDPNDLINELKSFHQRIFIASRNPMVSGKQVASLITNENGEFDETTLTNFRNLNEEDQLIILNFLMEPVDSKTIFMQAVNKIVDDFIVIEEKEEEVEENGVRKTVTKKSYKYIKVDEDGVGSSSNPNIKKNLEDREVRDQLKSAFNNKIFTTLYSGRDIKMYSKEYRENLPRKQIDMKDTDSEKKSNTR